MKFGGAHRISNDYSFTSAPQRKRNPLGGPILHRDLAHIPALAIGLLASCGSPRAPKDVTQAESLNVPVPPKTDSVLVRTVRAPLTPADFVVAKLEPLMDSVRVHELLGPPVSIHAEDDSRDPGAKLISWEYPGLIVLFGSYNALGGVWITDQRVATARGLRIGDSQDRVRDLYGDPPSDFMGQWQYESANDASGDVMQVEFVAGRVSRIYVGHIYD